MPKLGATGLDVFPLCLGGNVFGWTADQGESFAILDRYADAGGKLIDTANQYSYWAPGNSGGESETILGRWMAERGNRDQIVLASKVGGEMPGLPHDLRTDTIRRSARESLERLQTDRLDVFYAHFDDESTPLQETMAAFTHLVREGDVLHVGASNYTAARLAEMMEVVEPRGWSRSACCSRPTTWCSASSSASCSPCVRSTGSQPSRTSVSRKGS